MIFNGIEFPSQSAAAQSVGISVQTVWSRMKRHGCSFEDAAQEAARFKSDDMSQELRNRHPSHEHLGHRALSAKLLTLPFSKWAYQITGE